MMTIKRKALNKSFQKLVNLPGLSLKIFFCQLCLCLSLSLFSGFIYAIDLSQVDEQLKKADSIRTSDNNSFVKIISEIEKKAAHLTNEQQYYFQYLKGYEFISKGLINEAIIQYSNVEKNSNNDELRFRASISLVNLYALKKDWLKGVEYLNFIAKEYPNISKPNIKHQGMIIAAFFYNQLEQYDTAKSFTQRALDEPVEGRNLCITLGERLKADLSLLNVSRLEEDGLNAINVCTEINEFVIANVIRSYLASYYIKINKPEKTISLLEEFGAEINNSEAQLLITETNSLLAQSHFHLNNLDKAKLYALKVVQDDTKNDYIKTSISAYNILSKLAKNDAEFDLAFAYQEKYIHAKESLFEQTKAKQLAVESARHLAIEKDNQIVLLNKQKQISQLELESQKQKLLITSVVFIASAIILFLWFYRKTAQKELNRQKQVNWELQELDKLKDRILTNTSHELRTPLNGIIGLSELIVMEYENEVKDELISSIRLIGKSGTRLALIVNDILDLAQLKSGKIRFSFQEFDISNLIKEVISLCQPLIKAELIKFKFEEQGQTIVINQDKHRIQQILFNVIGNAIKFTDEGLISIHCEQQNENFLVRVTDTGIGIPPDKVNRIFKGFEQVDNSSSRRHQGSGIGLAITREIVTALGGEISIQSKLGEGSVVSFILPIINKEKH